MDAERWVKARSIFEAALGKPPAEREALVHEQAAADAGLAKEVLVLLAAHDEAEDFLERSDLTTRSATREDFRDDDDDPLLGRSIGAYELVRRLGCGGMGTVYLAVRSDAYRKRVALKLLRPAGQSPEMVHRFKAECQILAGLDHPNIARLLDGGTSAEGWLYFVLEYIEGQPIDVYCDAHRLPIRQRLELFCRVSTAVDFAHRNLVVHRDLKPGNILVTGDGTPKLLDFGIAKLLNPELTAPHLAATVAAIRLMTPEYASPEQVRGEAITTASDVYSLGVLLYGLLTGHHPYAFKTRSTAEVVQVICSAEPARPSAVVMTARQVTGDHGETKEIPPEAISAQRQLEPARLRRRLDGDLDNIVLKALRKSSSRRYPSVAQLSDDIKRHLDGLPVQARRGGAAYRLGKLLRRHQLGASVAGVFLLAAMLFGVALAWQNAALIRERDQAASERERAAAVTDFLQDLFRSADPLTVRESGVDVRQLLDQGALRLRAELVEQPEIRADLFTTLGTIYHRLGLFENAAPLLESALATRFELWGEEHPKVAESRYLLAALLAELGEYAAAEEGFRRALAVQQKLLPEEHLDTARTLNDFGECLHHQGKLDRAGELYTRALTIRRSQLGERHLEVAETLNNLGALSGDRGDLAAAERHHREALGIRRELLGARHVEVSESLNNLAAVLRAAGALDEARGCYEEALELRRAFLGETHPRVANTLNNLAGAVLDLGDPEAAEKLLREALAIYRLRFGERHFYVANVMTNLADALRARGDLTAARGFYEQAIPIFEATVGEHPKLEHARAQLAVLASGRAEP